MLEKRVLPGTSRHAGKPARLQAHRYAWGMLQTTPPPPTVLQVLQAWVLGSRVGIIGMQSDPGWMEPRSGGVTARSPSDAVPTQPLSSFPQF